MARNKREYENHAVLRMPAEAHAIAVQISGKWALATLPPLATTSKILAVDPGTANCAVALLCRNAITKEYETVFTTKIDPPAEFTSKPFMQSLYVQRIIECMIVDHVPSLVMKEGESHGSPMQAHNIGRVHQAIDMACYNTGRSLLVVNNQSVKAWFRASSKDEMRQQVYKKHRVEFPTNDECDAYAIAQTGLAIMRGEYPRPKPPKTPKPAKAKPVVKAPARKKASTRKVAVRKTTRKKSR